MAYFFGPPCIYTTWIQQLRSTRRTIHMPICCLLLLLIVVRLFRAVQRIGRRCAKDNVLSSLNPKAVKTLKHLSRTWTFFTQTLHRNKAQTSQFLKRNYFCNLLA